MAARRHEYASMTTTRSVEDPDEEEPTVGLHVSVWAMLCIGGIIGLAILGIVIANLVITEDNKNEVNNIWHNLKGVKTITVVKEHSSSSDSDDKDCDKCLQPFGPCTKRLPKLLEDYPCCVTLFEDKFVAKFPLHPKRHHRDDDYDGPESRWSYANMNHRNCKALNEGAEFDMEDAAVVATTDDSFVIESEPQLSVGPGELGPGTGLLDTIKFAMGPSGSYMVKKDTKLVLQAVIKATVKLPKWHPYEWDGDKDDPRLGHVGAMLWDWDSGISAGVVFTEQGVWTMYNRHPGKYGHGNWHSGKRHYDNDHEKEWCIRIVFCSKTRTITFYINDKKVYVINKVGGLPDRDHRDMFVYRGGEPNEVEPESFRAFLMGGNVLDGAMGEGGEGLMQLDNYDYVEPTTFRHSYDKNDKSKRVYGQKYLVIVTKFKVDICERAEEEEKSKSRDHYHDKSSSSDDHHKRKHDDSSSSDDDHKKKKHHSSSKSERSYDHEKEKSRSRDHNDWKDEKKKPDWKDEKKPEWEDDDKKKPSWNYEKHSNSEEWWKKHQEKWENSNDELWKKWDNDFVHAKSESEKHAENQEEHHEKSENWEKGQHGK